MKSYEAIINKFSMHLYYFYQIKKVATPRSFWEITQISIFLYMKNVIRLTTSNFITLKLYLKIIISFTIKKQWSSSQPRSFSIVSVHFVIWLNHIVCDLFSSYNFYLISIGISNKVIISWPSWKALQICNFIS